LELTCRGAFGSGGHQKGGPKPVSQGLSSSGKEGAGGQRGVVSTVPILIQGKGFNGIGPRVATPLAVKATGPLASDEIPGQSRSVRKPRRNCLGVIEKYMVYLRSIDKAVQ